MMIKTLINFINFVRFEHSIFALPFALSGALLASENTLPRMTLLWIILAMVSARSLAMSLNRIIDKDIDSKNPRTQNRELVIGKIKLREAIIFSIVSLLTLLFATLQLPRICLSLLPIAVIWFYIYPYTKRFTALSHLWLGIALGASVIGGWLAIRGNLNSIEPIILGAAVTFWVAGFDIIYACQDHEFDTKNKLYSIPAKFGIKNSLIISRLFHTTAIVFLIILGTLINSSYIYWFSVIFVAGMLLYEQSLVKHNDLSKVNIAFFNINGWVSIGFFIFMLLEKAL